MSSSTKRVTHHLPSLLLTVMHILLPVQATTNLTARTSSSIPPVPCHPDQASALLRLKHSFDATVGDYSTAFRSWVAGTDCCRWDGVGCGSADGRVTSLDLGGQNLQAGSVDPALFRLTSLKHLNLSSNNFSMSQLPVITGFERLTELVYLDLSDTNIAGELPASIGRLTNLVYLDLSTSFYIVEYNDDEQVTFNSDSVWQLSAPNMETLLENLSNLEELHMGMVDLSGNGERWCYNIAKYTPKLQVLSLPYCSLSGPICASFSSLQALTMIELHYNRLSGSVPEFLAGFSNLTVLQLSRNKFQGSFPPIIFQHKKLRTINLSKNPGISGNLPNFSQDTSLENLFLNNTNFTGTVPPQILNLTRLQTLLLHSNNFAGTVDLTSFSKLKNLTFLNLSNNKLLVVEGKNSSSLVSFPKLQLLSLASCSMTTFPNILRDLPDITSLDLSNNQIQGAIPQWAWKTWKGLQFIVLNISHNNFTSLGSDPFLPLYVEYFDLSFNSIEGPIPIPQEGSSTLDYSSNQFSYMPLRYSTYLGETVTFKASKNKLSGNVPPLICTTARKLQLIDLSYNNLSGSIPSCLLESFSELQVLSLKANKFVGKLPDIIKEGCALEALDLSDNSIEGKIPRSLVSCRNLEILDIGSNQISDSFPCWLSQLPKLQVLVLKSNKLTGQVMDPSYTGRQISCEFPALRIADMASNNLNGMLMEGWFKMLKSMMARSDNDTLVMENQYYHGQTYQFTATVTYKGNDRTISKILRSLVLIDVSSNAFHGAIPDTIGELVLLRGLNLSHNALTGPIPSQFGRLDQLESLDLSFNELSGEIPKELASLNFLSTLNLANNTLVGRIPDSYQFSTFSNSSFLGNTGLCGPPLSRQCDNPEEPIAIPYTSEKSIDAVLLLFTALGFGISFAMTILIVWGSHMRKRH
ncbi:hypothetical protein OsJ_12035 [Oryza sativa Japonica Group]|uniref:non-specific serine/threonine protein kinase n=1 Tax=Oryza sativa subsp. japonica TaxID=39947 RepID=A3AL82_ORYSJ|nr:hypothetical protein OsJ_12035 [Oryza sativa Japonica Group]